MDGSNPSKRSRSSDTACTDADRLGNLDWSFTTRDRAPAIEGIHPYPAKFIGEIPRAFIQNLEIPDETWILDPFCGSGTSLVEAQRAGHRAVGIDLNPIACLISRVKTSPLPTGFQDAVAEVVARARALRRLRAPEIPNIDHWFKPDVQQAVGALGRTIADETFAAWQDQLRATLSSILVRVSNQDSDTRYAAVEKEVSSAKTFDSFISASKKLEDALANRDWPLSPAKVIEANTLEVKPADVGVPVGLVVTSPPYPNAYEYWLYHKYRMWWLGFDPIAVREKEIGARAHFFKKASHTPEIFFDQMSGAFNLIQELLVPGGYVCFVVGRSKIHGQIVDNGLILEKVAKNCGLSLVSRIERTINSQRKSFNLSHANIKTESVLIFHKS
nr:DNA methyltransferase [uncultured Pseudoxanthomonas sp.]